MATRLYFHQALNGLSNLPTTEQSSLTADKQVDAFTVNRLMDTTIGTAQTSLVLTSNATTSIQEYYFSCFVSLPLSGISSITAQTWTYNYATGSSLAGGIFPAATASSVPVRITCYVWRPSTQTKVGDILDGTGGLGRGTTTERSQVGTFTGALVSGVQDGDVICFEVWFEITQSIASVSTDSFYYDGTTVTATNFFGVTNHASFIETPQNLTFGAILTRVSLTRIYQNKIQARVSLTRIYQNKIRARVALSRIYTNKIRARVSLSRVYKNKIRARISLSRVYQNKIRARVALSRIYKNKIRARVALSRIYKNKIRARVSLTRIYRNRVLVRISSTKIYKNRILVRISLSRIYKNKIRARVALSRIYKNKIVGRISLSRIYKNKIRARVSLTRIYRNRILIRLTLSKIYKNRILIRVSLSRIYKNRILNRISLSRIYKNRLLIRVTRTRTYLNKIRARVSVSRTYKNRILFRISLSRVYKNKIRARISLSRIYQNKIRARVSLFRIYKNKIRARVALSRVYKNKIAGRVALTRIYQNKIRSRVSLTRIYKNRVLNRISLSRIYKNKIVGRISLSRVYKNKILVRISLSRVYKNRILKRVNLVRIYKNRILKRVALSRIYKNRILNRISLTRIYKNRILSRVSLSRIYKNKIVARVSLTRRYVNKIIVVGLTRISLDRTYKNKITARVSNPRIYKNRLLQRVGANSIRLPLNSSYLNLGNEPTLWAQAKTKFSFSLWVKPDALNTGAFLNVINHNWQAVGSFIVYYNTTGYNIVFALRDSAAQKAASAVGTIGDVGIWTHYVGVYDSTLGSQNVKLYKNKVLGATTGICTEAIGTLAGLTIGAASSGVISNVKDFRWFTSKALTQQEVNDICDNSPSAPTPDYWLEMDERTGNPVDAITGTKTGVLTNSARWTYNAPDPWIGKLQVYKNRLLQRIGTWSVSLDGIDDYMTPTPSNDASLWSQALTKFSISMWLYLTAQGGTRVIFSHGVAPTVHALYCYQPSSSVDRLTFRVVGTGAVNKDATINYGSTFTNKWIHLTCVYDSTLANANLKIYLDTVQGAITADLTETVNLSTNMFLSGSTADLQGYMKDFRWFTNKALTTTEISQVYQNNPAAPTPNYWLKMNEGAGSVIDSITGTKTAAFNNGSIWKPVAPDVWTGMLEIYINKISQRISLSQTYVNRLLQRVGAYAISFDGVNDYLDLGSDSVFDNLTNGFTWTFWMFPTQGGTSYRTIIKNQTYPSAGGFELWYGGATPSQRYLEFKFNLNGINYFQGFADIGINTWGLCVISWDNITKKSYVKFSTFTSTSGVRPDNQIFGVGLGLQIARTASGFAGNIKDVRFFRSALTVAQINDIENNVSTLTPDYWLMMDEGTGNPVDTITETKTATLMNGAKWTYAAPNVWIGKLQTYKNRIFLRVSLSRVYKNKIFGRVSLSRVYKNRILNRLSLSRIYKNRIRSRVSSSRVYKNRILNRISLSRIYKNRIFARISLLRTYRNRIRSRVSLTRIYKNRILLRASLTRIYKNRISVRVSLSRIYKNRIRARISLSRVYTNRILNRVAFTRTYKNRILSRVSRSRIYKNRILSRMSLSRVYKNRILVRMSSSRIYKNRILNRLSLSRIYKNRILNRVSLSRIYKNQIIGRISLSRIYQNQIQARISLNRIYKNMILIRVSLPRVYKNSILERVSLDRTYINQILVVLSRVSLTRTYKNKIQGRVSLTRIYINVIEKAKKHVRIGFNVREKIPRTTSFLRGLYDRTTNR